MADTLVRKAEGEQFDALVRMYGLPRVSWLPVKSWRQAALAGNFAKRDSLGTIYKVLREALRSFDDAFVVKVDPTVSKTRLYWVSGGASVGFTRADLSRLWEIDSKVYWSTVGDGVYGAAVAQVSTVTVNFVTVHNRLVSWQDENNPVGFNAVFLCDENITTKEQVAAAWGAVINGPVSGATAVVVGNVLTITAKVPGSPLYLANLSHTAIGLPYNTTTIAPVVANVPFGGTTPYIELTPYDSPQWKGCDWSKDTTTPAGVWTEKAAAELPFVYRGYGAILEVFIKDISPCPPTYLQSSYSWTVPSTAFGDVPLAGFGAEQVVEQAGTLIDLSLAETPQTHETHSVGVTLESAVTINVLSNGIGFAAAGNVNVGSKVFSYTGVTGHSFTGCALVSAPDGLSVPDDARVYAEVTPARGGVFTATLYKNNVITALTCDLLANGSFGSDGTHSVSVVAGDKLMVFITSAAGTTVGLDHPHVAVYQASPTGEPLGGNMLNNASVDDPATGPWPIYLGGDPVDKEWYLVLDNMVAFGVVVKCRKTQTIAGA